MGSETWVVGWVISLKDQEIKVLRRNRKHRLSRNETHPNIVIGDWIAFRKNTVSGQGCLIQIIDPILPTKTLWISPKIGNRSRETQCICVKTTAIGSPNVQLQEGDSEIHRIWSPHFEYLADPLHLFDDPVNVKPNVAYDVWCRLNSDPKSQYDGVSPILEIHSIEAPSESQMISLGSPWVRWIANNPANQASSLYQPSLSQQSTMTCQESSAEPHEQFRESEEMCKEEQLQSNDEKKSIGKVNDGHFDAATDLIIKQLTERRSLYRQHRQEAKAAKSLSATQSLSMNQWITEEKQRTDHADNLTTFLASNVNDGVVNSSESSAALRASFDKLIQDLRPLIRAQLRFHRRCAQKMEPKDSKWQNLLEATRRQLEMNEKEFDENVLTSPLAMQIVHRSCGSGNTGTQQTSANIQLPSTKHSTKSGKNRASATETHECNVNKQQKAKSTQAESSIHHRPLGEEIKSEVVDSTERLSEGQHETECTADTSLDLITKLLCERLKMVQSHSKECQDAIKVLNSSSMAALMRHQRKQQMGRRERHTKIVSEFAANHQKGCYKSRYTYEETSRILGMLRSELRSYLAFYLSSIYACNENGIEGEKEQVTKELGMNEKEFDENIVLSKEILSILDAYSPSTCPKVAENHVPPAADVQSSQKTHNKNFAADNPKQEDKQPSAMIQKSSLMNPGLPVEEKTKQSPSACPNVAETQVPPAAGVQSFQEIHNEMFLAENTELTDKQPSTMIQKSSPMDQGSLRTEKKNSNSTKTNRVYEAVKLKKSDSTNIGQPKTAFEFIVDQLRKRKTLYWKHGQEAGATEELSARQSLSLKQWYIEEDQRKTQESDLAAFLESNPHAEESIPRSPTTRVVFVKRILSSLRFFSRGQIIFHQNCAKRMNPEDEFSKMVLETTQKWLKMDREQFENNVMASPLAMRIIRKTLASVTIQNQPNPRKATKSSNIKQSDSGNSKQPETAIEFIVDQMKERKSLYQKHRQEANATEELSAKQSISVKQWLIERTQRDNQASALKAFLNSNPQAEKSIPNSSVVSEASIRKIFQQLRSYSRAQIRFHQECAERMNPNDEVRKVVLETTKEWLEMGRRRFEDNVLASPLAMRIIRRTFDGESTPNPLNNQQPILGNQLNRTSKQNPLAQNQKSCTENQPTFTTTLQSSTKGQEPLSETTEIPLSKLTTHSRGQRPYASTDERLIAKGQFPSNIPEKLPTRISYCETRSKNCITSSSSQTTSATAQQAIITSQKSHVQQFPCSNSIQSAAKDHCKIVEHCVTPTSNLTTTLGTQLTSTSSEQRLIRKQQLTSNVPEKLPTRISYSGTFSNNYISSSSSQTTATFQRAFTTQVQQLQHSINNSRNQVQQSSWPYSRDFVTPTRKERSKCIIL